MRSIVDRHRSEPANSDPFGPTGPTRRQPRDRTTTATTIVDCLTVDTVATADIELSDFGDPALAKLINVCSYPSREPNSDPSDCVFEPNNGFLTIVKTADDATTPTCSCSTHPPAGFEW